MRLRHRNHKPYDMAKLSIEELKAKINWLVLHKVWTYTIVSASETREQDELDKLFGLEPETEDSKMVYIPASEHLYGGFQEAVDFDFVFVDPATKCIEEDDSRNTRFRVWIEAHVWVDLSLSQDSNEIEPQEGWNDYNKWQPSHDTDLDCGGWTMEEALLALASLVELHYNEDGTSKELNRCEGGFDGDKPVLKNYRSGCTADADGFCTVCNFAV